MIIEKDKLEQFREDGYMILENVIPDDHLQLLQDLCQKFIDQMDAQMDKEGTDVLGITHRNKRYFVSNCLRKEPKMADFLFSDYMADICRATLGDDVYLFNEQYVIKGAEEGMKFSWHQDSGYVGFPDHRPYLSCWCALDDMSEENGTVSVMPFSRIGIRTWVKHTVEEGSNDKVGYFGNDPGVPVVVPKGSIAVFTSLNFHSSGTNTTSRMRRTYLAQYSAEPLTIPSGEKLWGNAVPFLRNGKSAVGDPPPDLPSRLDTLKR